MTLGFASRQDIQDLSDTALDTTWPAHADRTYTLDQTAPSPAIAPSSATGSAFVATIAFSEDVEDFGDVGDVTATNATVAALSRSDGRTYTVQVTPTTASAATISLAVPANAAKDAVGNSSVATSQAVAYNPSSSVSLAVAGLSKGSAAEDATWTSATPAVTGSPVGTVSWTKEGVDADHFTIDSTTGVLGLSGLDFELPVDQDGNNEYEVTARATDTEGNSATAAVTVTVNDAAETRSLRIDGAFSKKIPETRSYGAKLALLPKLVCPGNVCAVGDGPVGAVTWSKTGADAAHFELDTRTGDLSLPRKDYEHPADANSDNDYEMTVQGTDADGNSVSKGVTVRVVDGHPRWLTISGLADASAEENSEWTSAALAAEGGPIGELTWTREGPDAVHFVIDPDTGILTMAAQDYEAPGDADRDRKYEVTVRVTDGGSNSAATSISVTVTGVNEPPETVGTLAGQDLQVGDGDESVDVSGGFRDVDGDTLTYGASSSAPGVARARASGSRVTLTPVAAGVATITVTATDVTGSNTPATQIFDVSVDARRGVTISRDALTVEEGSTGSYTVVLDSEPTGPVTVTPSVPVNRDLSVDPTELTFNTGDWRVPKTVLVEAATDTDTAADAPVTIGHQVSGSDYGSVRASSVRVTILETDRSTLSVEAAEASETVLTLVFQVTLSRSSTSDVTVDYATSDGSGSAGARAGSDYVAASGTLTLSNAQHASLAGGGSTLQVTGTIRDDDDPEVEVSFGSASYDVTEGGTVDVVVRLNRDPERDLVIDLVRTHHGGTTDADYSGVPSHVTFGAGVRIQEFLFAATDDSADDDGEAVVLGSGSLPPRVTAGGSGETTLAIQDNDGRRPPSPPPPPPQPPPAQPPPPPPPDEDPEVEASFGSSRYEVLEGRTVEVTVVLSADAEREVSIPLVRIHRGGASEADYSGVPERVTFSRGVTTRTFEFEATDDSKEDFGEAVVLGFGGLPPGVSGGGAATVSIEDDDTPPMAVIEVSGVECDRELCRALTGEPVQFADMSTGPAASRRWEFGEGTESSLRRLATNDSGLFTFFNRENWEILIKVLDGCTLNGHVWVYGASTTDLGYRVRVTDTVTGTVKEYGNEPGLPAPAITDAQAFQACAR